MPVVLIALGSNLGDRTGNLRAALELLSGDVWLRKCSHVYETAPMYVTDQPTFLNAAVAVETKLSPISVFRLLKSIEASVGRQERDRMGPREIDLDLISYGNVEYKFFRNGEPVLQLPHPRAHERRFVLQPLMDIGPDALLPPRGTVAELLGATDAQAPDVVRLDGSIWRDVPASTAS